MTMKKIKKAILPVAGFGTRFLPATKNQPKEMFPVVDKPVIQYLVEEAVASGIEEIVFVISRGKESIEGHFDAHNELEQVLKNKGKDDFLKEIRDITNLAKFSYVRQAEPLGDGHAVLQARHIIGNEPVLVLFGDCIYDSKVPAGKQLIDAFYKSGKTVIGTSVLESDEVSKFGVVEGDRDKNGDIIVSKFIEKPDPSKTDSRDVSVGKYVITPEIFEILADMKYGASGEIRLADAFELAIGRGIDLRAHTLEGVWLDTGDKFNFLKTTVHMALKHPEFGDKLRDYLGGLEL